jgi:DNA-binding NarL/FixJ family response regulator
VWRVPVRVVFADDDYLVREGVRRLLEQDRGMEFVASYSEAAPLLARLAHDAPDVVITDLRMPPSWDDEGIELAEQLQRLAPDVGVIVLSQVSKPDMAARIFGDGAQRRAYLLKEHVVERAVLVRVIHEVAGGGSYVDPDVVVSLVAARRATPSPLDGLTPRERDVVALVAEGLSNDAIAGRLELSKRSVEGHINSIFVKLRLPDERRVSRRVAAALLFLSEMGTGQ